jgi:hypothetical protein
MALAHMLAIDGTEPTFAAAAERATGGGAELDVGGRLEGEQGADEQKEGNRECLHRTPRNWTQRPWLLGPDPIRNVGQP